MYFKIDFLQPSSAVFFYFDELYLKKQIKHRFNGLKLEPTYISITFEWPFNFKMDIYSLDTHTEPKFLTQIILDVKREQNLQESTSPTILVHIHNSQPTNFFFQSYTAIYFGHSELSRVEKSRFESRKKSSVYY